ncbi:MAG: Cof-type HAD-IIB family hydrolase [Lachnospiraceae bacterium]|nr:Cof-type HAD-IIB family hydrolase [Lachnospiraceae bacterium]
MKRKALFFDIDGTLLSDRTKELPESAQTVIRRAQEMGHLVFINSGRARCLMQEVEEKLQTDGYLCGCGTLVEIQGSRALHHVISAKRRLEIQRSIIACDVDGVLEGTGGLFAQSCPSRFPEVERLKNLFVGRDVMFGADWTLKALPFDKFCIVADEKSNLSGFFQSLEPDFSCIDRGHGLFECVPRGYDKATAMKFILDYFGIPWEESYAFGDSSNDLAMIRYACHSVVMGEHDAVLEPYASLITKTVEDDGIAWAFEKLNILG